MAKGSAPPAMKSVVQDGVTFNAANQHIQYWASSHRQVRTGALVDRGANGGIAGDDVWIINRTGQQVDVQGIDNHQIVDIPVVTAGAVMKTQRGEAIIIMHQYTYTGKGKTIHSSGHSLSGTNKKWMTSLSRLAGSSISRLWMAMLYLLTSRVVYLLSRCGRILTKNGICYPMSF
jgi:hypothetical protein